MLHSLVFDKSQYFVMNPIYRHKLFVHLYFVQHVSEKEKKKMRLSKSIQKKWKQYNQIESMKFFQ